MTRRPSPIKSKLRRAINWIVGTIASTALGTGVFLLLDKTQFGPWMLISAGVLLGGGLLAFNLLR